MFFVFCVFFFFFGRKKWRRRSAKLKENKRKEVEKIVDSEIKRPDKTLTLLSNET